MFLKYIQYDYLADFGETPEEHQMFRFRRVRVQLAGPPEKDVTWAVAAELTGLPALRDAYVALNYLPAATIRIGQLVMPFYGLERYVASSNTLEFTERLLADLAPGRDAGVMVSNARPFFGWLSYEAAIINGTGQNMRDNNSAKDVMLRLTASPLRPAGLHLAANATRGDQPTGMRTRTGTDVRYERRSYHLAAEFLREATEGGRTRKHGFYGFESWRIYRKRHDPPCTTRGGCQIWADHETGDAVEASHLDQDRSLDVTEPGFTEVDLASHSGDRADGEFVQSAW